MKVDPSLGSETMSYIPEYVAMDDVLAGHLSTSSGPATQGVTTGHISDVEARLEETTFRKDLSELLVELSPRERRGVLLFYGLAEGEEMTFAALGRKLNISREGARQLIKRSLEKMRSHPKIALLKEYC
jgi:RNA polymerase sigma factor (sigma-70 family)